MTGTCVLMLCSDAGKFIAAALVSLTTMIRLELPHVNVLSKVGQAFIHICHADAQRVPQKKGKI